MLTLLHYLLLAGYAITPIFYAAVMTHRWHAGPSRAAMRSLAGTAWAAVLLGTAVSVFFAVALGARTRFDQSALAAFYFMTVLIVFKGLLRAGAWLGGRVGGSARWRRFWPAAGQLVLVGLVGVPYGMAAIMTYRPKVGIVGSPLSEYGWRYQIVKFRSLDGVELSGWWIPALAATANDEKRAGNAGRTVLVCHGLGANKLNQLQMARVFYERGYNVLAFDFRAHGESGGQFTSYGDLERRDVLGAVRWLKATHADRSAKVVGVGASLGGAALLAGATQRDSVYARAIDGVILYGTYGDLGTLTGEVAARFVWPVNWLARYVAVPLASVHAGTNLQAFAPVAGAGEVSPRALVVVHGRRDEMIPVHQGEDLFRAAREPKKLILLDADHNSLIEDDATARRAVDFVEANLGR